MEGNGNKKSFFGFFLALCLFVQIILVSSFNAFAIESIEDFEKALVSQSGFSISDLEKLRNQEYVVKILPSEDKREVSVFGVAAINAPIDKSLKEFQAAMSRQNKKSIMQFGDFGSQPKIEDLEQMTLEKNDFDDLKKCLETKCGFRLSAEFIERIRKEIDWNAADYRERATSLYRRLIVEYVNDYLARGNAALMEYKNQPEIISLPDEQKSLLKRLVWIEEFAPEFAEYLLKYPSVQMPNIKRTLSWSKIKFGLKPVIMISETVTYTSEKAVVSQVLSVSRQIYASRYFDSSLGLTAIVKFNEKSEKPSTYLLYTNHSRSSSLEGTFSELKHEIVEREAIDKLKPLLSDTKLRLERKDEPTPIDEASSTMDFLRENVYWIIGLSVALIILLWFLKRAFQKT